MSSVWADKEEVVFDGEIPVDPSRVYDLLMGALSEQGRVVVEFLVDGVDALREGKFPDQYEKIEIASQTHDELTLRLIMETMKHLVGMEEQFTAYACNILRTPWSEVFKRMEELINKVKPFAELMDNLTPYVQTYTPAWKEKFENLASEQADSLGQVLNGFEQGNPAGLSEELGIRFLEVFKKGRKLFNEEIIPDLKGRIVSA